MLWGSMPRGLQPSLPRCSGAVRCTLVAMVPPPPPLPPTLSQELLVNLADSRSLVEALLTSLPVLHGANRTMESALGPALDAAFNVMQHIGGKMVVLQASRVRQRQPRPGVPRRVPPAPIPTACPFAVLRSRACPPSARAS